MNNEKIFQIVFDKLIATMERADKWVKPWAVSYVPPVNLISGNRYRGINNLILGIGADAMGFKSSTWLSFKQIKDKGGKLKKGSKGMGIIFYKMLTGERTRKNGKVEETNIPLMRYSTVFNLDQCEGIEDKYAPEPVEPNTDINPIEAAQALIDLYKDGPSIKFGGDRAFFNPLMDLVRVPNMESYKLASEYYSTMFHELVHSTGHKKRLDRLAENFRFGDHEYSREELVAEIGASFLRNICDIEEPETLKNSAAYIKGWWKKLKKDPDAMRWAAAKAQKAVDFMTGVEATKEARETTTAAA